MITVTDLFCGAGGSSSGAEAVAGVRVRMACNHWQLAIDTHNTNMPHVDHDRADIAEVDPRRYPATDILWASPSCTFWSQARGERQDFADQPCDPALFDLADTADTDDEPASIDARERSRALMADVPRFAEHHRYKAVIVENTPPLLKWWYFPKWIARMRALGYQHQVLTLNSAFAHQLGAPAPQLRDRVYVVFWQQRYRAPDFQRWTRPRAWCPSCEQVVTALYAPKNARRPFGAYWQQYVYRCPQRACRAGIAHPYTLPAAAAIDWSAPGSRIGDRTQPLAPNTLARIEAGLRRYVHPFVTVLRTHGGNQQVADPFRTFVAGTTSQALLVPVEGREGKRAVPATAPARTQTGRRETALLVPAGGTWNDTAASVAAPMRARTAREAEAVVMIPLRNHNRPKKVDEPLDTVAAAGNHHGLVFLMRNNTPRGDGGQMCTPVSQPARTFTAGGKQSLVWAPNVMFAYDTGAFRALGRPLPTQTTVPGDGLVETAPDVADCLFRMLLPEEIKLGMAFAPAFVLLGNKRERVRLCGNAVTPPVARDLVAAVVEAITGEEVSAA